MYPRITFETDRTFDESIDTAARFATHRRCRVMYFVTDVTVYETAIIQPITVAIQAKTSAPCGRLENNNVGADDLS
jgi:hypothetical protein